MNTKFHNVEDVSFEGTELILHADGELYRVPIARVSGRLAKASESARRSYRISPSGYGIHWPEADEDLSVDGLIRAATEPAQPTKDTGAYVLKDQPKP